jgi:glycosyltransferase involved in cell wall biosynthesis
MVAALPLPKTAVLVPVLDRKEYLLEALDSVRAGAPADTGVELLVLSNLDEADLRRAAESRGARFVHLEDRSLGGKLEEALRISDAGLFALLDDDDLFEPGRLEGVRALFARSPGLLYYHNEQTRVDLANRPLPPSPRAAPPATAPLEILPHGRGEGLRALVDRDPDFNDSSIVVRRAVLETARPAFPGLTAVDSLLFYTALTMDGTLWIDPAARTRYRVHPANTTRGTATSERELLERLHRSSVRTQSDYERVVDHLAPRAEPIVRLHLEAILAVNSFYRALRNPDPSRSEMYRALRAVRPVRATFFARTNRRALRAGWVFLLFPRWVQSMYLREVARLHPGTLLGAPEPGAAGAARPNS